MMRVRERLETVRELSQFIDLIGAHIGELIPRHACRRFDTNALKRRPAGGHGNPLGGEIRRVRGLLEHHSMVPHTTKNS